MEMMKFEIDTENYFMVNYFSKIIIQLNYSTFIDSSKY